MNSEPENRRYRQTIGSYLCHHSADPPVENVDRLSSRDLRQEAALRAVVALRKLGKPVTEDAIASFDAEPQLVAMAYRWVRQDAIKRQLGRGASERPTVVRTVDATLADPSQRAALEAIEDDALDELRRLAERGIDGLSQAQTARVLVLMRQVQAIKEKDSGPIPVALRKQVSRLRRETHLPLGTRLL